MDFEKLDYIASDRALFTFDLLIKEHPSYIPFAEGKLKTVVRKLGGWTKITAPEFNVSEDVYILLATAGLNKDQFDLSRRYIADKNGYRFKALAKRRLED